MKDRCFNRNNKNFYCYGGKGILVCDEWMDFASFRDWSAGNGYHEDLTIDRIDNNKGYNPDNCRWVSFETQWKNKSGNVKVIRGDGVVFQTLTDAARSVGTYHTAIKRACKANGGLASGFTWNFLP